MSYNMIEGWKALEIRKTYDSVLLMQIKINLQV